MEYPLIIGGAATGRLSISQSGLYTLIEAELPAVREGIYRIWLHGGGERAYLGLLQPWSGGMYLRRRLSRRDMEAFPKNIEYASDEDKTSLHNTPQAEEAPAEPAAPEDSAPACPYPAPIPDEGEELLWFRRPDGSLVAFDGISSLVALPARLRTQAPGAVLRRIEGGEYMVFRY